MKVKVTQRIITHGTHGTHWFEHGTSFVQVGKFVTFHRPVRGAPW